MFSPSSWPPMASSARISVATLQPKSHHRKPDASTASRSPSKTSTARCTYSSLTQMSRITKKMHLLRAIKTVSCVQRKTQWALRWCDFTTASFAKCMIVFAAVLEENARANPDARIRPLTHASVDQAHQAELVGRNSLFSILIAIRCSPNL